MNPKKINEFVDKILSAIPEELRNASFDWKKNIRATVEDIFNRLDLVTREEFDAQTKVLHRARQKLVELEKLISALEK